VNEGLAQVLAQVFAFGWIFTSLMAGDPALKNIFYRPAAESKSLLCVVGAIRLTGGLGLFRSRSSVPLNPRGVSRGASAVGVQYGGRHGTFKRREKRARPKPPQLTDLSSVYVWHDTMVAAKKLWLLYFYR
jgi:hypothetical protein